ncbi:vesicle-associated membrane protein 711, partial [Tanacetum coccineum]
MTIVYALVARGSVILAEFSDANTNGGVIARQIVEKIKVDNNDVNVSYSQNKYVFHVKQVDGLTCLCMADDLDGRRVPFAFLEDIHQRFVKTYGRAILSAQAYGMNDEFSRVLSQQMEYYSNDQNADRINRLKGEMSQVRTVMLENIDKVLERGDRLEILVHKTATMQNNTLRFKKQSRRYRNAVWRRNVKLMFALIFLLLVLVYVLVAFACHGLTLPTCLRRGLGVRPAKMALPQKAPSDPKGPV